VIRAADPHGRILGFLDRAVTYLLIKNTVVGKENSGLYETTSTDTKKWNYYC
jgi:hypothetical protein